ncbi:DNA polymerase III subunit gamma/tau [Candidatus Colwellia aromaticivorans]|uniref:DNA polymerase III subunit gamma/tau n=1 Tax=Candidatus Colwellia aromaticivorans TaxID=2267621 RepID=UPI000DF1F4E0|nr:DNA polymerase III subunit gamma/tau [Candidatus Colwellia aromaticivorans]
MSYQVLARKWRPKKFEELMGQEHVVTVLVNALAQERLHHAYLFTGTRGVGKTTIARIFAKSLNCETGITATPCGICDTCLEIDQGRFVDLLEIDAASKTKVDDTREILDNVQYAPTRGRYKVYLIDEVHMLSRHSFNALLKTLEEPPEHVKFILATTDPQKLPVTVLSRCLQFHLKALTVSQIETKLTEILVKEDVNHEKGTLTLLAKAARGSMRDSLSLTDQAIAQGRGNITLANIQQMLGGLDQNWIYKIVIDLLKQDGKSLMALTQKIASCAPSYSRLFAELIQLFHQIAILQIVDQHFDLSPEHAQLLKKFSQAMSPEDVQLYYQICVNGRKDLSYASDEQAAFDMTLLRMFAFKPMQKEQLPAVDTNSLAPRETYNFDDNSFTLPKTQAPAAQLSETNTELSTPASEPTPVQEKEQQLAQEMAAIEQQAVEMQDVSVKPEITSDEFTEPELELSPKQAPVQESAIAHEVDLVQEQKEVTEQVQQSQNKSKTTEFDSPLSAVLATRNMLRSRKKQLEQQEKKPGDAIARQSNTNQANAKSVEAVAKNTIDVTEKKVELSKPEQPYQAENINPATIRKANQVDKWAHMIDSMELTARLRQLAIHATIDKESTEEHLILCLNQATKHLVTDTAQQQLQQNISQFLSREVTVTIKTVEETVADPYQIQSHINDKRYDYAKELLEKDDIVLALQHDFQASLDEDSISAL